ncbi:MAG: efflux RND transporter periplasmic adaptor subunit [Proteobacteria bacterium]|nr:efflux RND transporter periplasmic adaptor subunit [Pseudomonadota bacterium]
MKRSYIIAGVLALATVGWMASGRIGESDRPKTGRKPPVDLSLAATVPTVRVRRQSAEPHTLEVILRGRTEAVRKVDVKAETHGRIVELAVAKGDRVKAGDVIARLSPEDRPARLVEATALREQRRLEYKASRSLSQKGYRAETQVAASKAALEAAKAAVTRAQVEVRNTVIRAPFDGVVSDRMAEMGDFIDRGDAIVRILDLDPVLAVAQIGERDLSRVWVGGRARVTLVDGSQIDGTIRFVDTEADTTTRTFRIEVELPNPTASIADGLTAELRLQLGTIAAHRVSPAILTLTDDGVIGVKTIGMGNKALFQPVRIIGDGPDGVWLTGLPDRVTLITVGQDFVTDGQRVRPIDEATLAPPVDDDS